MSTLEIQSVLTQLRALQARASSPAVQAPDAAGAASGTAATSFGTALTQAISQVNRHQVDSQQLAHRFELGDKSVGLADVMLASSQAQVSFTALTQVRNRFVRAYQDVMSMPI